MTSSTAGTNAHEEWTLKGSGNANMVFAYEGSDPRLVGLVLRVRKRARKHGPQHQASGSNPQPASRPPTGSSANTLPYATLAAAPPAGELAFKLSAMELHPPCPLVASSRSSSSRFQAPTLKAQQHANCACVGGPLPSQYGVSLQSLPEPQGTLPVRARGDGAECHAPEFDVPQSRAPPGSQILPSIQQSQQHQEEQQQQNIEVQGGQRQQQEQQQQEQQQEQECKDNEAEEQEEEEGLQSDEEAWEAAGAAATAHLERAVWGNVLRSEDPVDREFEYVNKYLGPMLGPQYVCTGVRVPVPPVVAQKVEAAGFEVAPHMPAILLPDHTVFTAANEGPAFQMADSSHLHPQSHSTGALPRCRSLASGVHHLQQQQALHADHHRHQNQQHQPPECCHVASGVHHLQQQQALHADHHHHHHQNQQHQQPECCHVASSVHHLLQQQVLHPDHHQHQGLPHHQHQHPQQQQQQGMGEGRRKPGRVSSWGGPCVGQSRSQPYAQNYHSQQQQQQQDHFKQDPLKPSYPQQQQLNQAWGVGDHGHSGGVGGVGWGHWRSVGPVVSVELKPKSGCMPTGPHLDPATAPLKARYPRYIMHSLLKHLQGRGMLSAYDPRDFFSRDPHRVAKALRALFAVPNNNIRVFLAGKLIFSGAQQEQQHSKEPTSHYRHCSLDLARYLGSNHGMHTVRSTDSLVGHAGHTHSMSRAGSSLGRAGSSGCRMARASSYCGLAGLADRENRPRILGKERSTSFAQSGVPPPPAPSPHPKWMRGLEHQLMPFLAVAMASSESAAAAAASAAARVDMQQRVARARRAAAAAPMPPHAKQVPTAAAGSTGACPVAFGGRGTAAASGCAGASPSALGGAGGAGPAGAGSFGGGGHYGSGIGFAERETATPSSAPSSPEGFSKQHLQQQQQQQYAQPSTLSRSRTPPHPSKPRPSLAVPAQSATTTAVTSPPTPTIAPRSARVPTTDTAITTAREANNTLTADHAIPSLTSTCPPSIANSNITTAAGIAREGGSCNQPSTAADTLKESPTEARADLHQPMAIATAPPHTLTPPLPTEQRAAPSSSTPIHPGPSSYLPATGAGNGMSSSPVRAGLPSSPAAAKPQSPWPTTMLQPEGDRETSEEAAHAASPLTAAPPQQPPQQQQQPPILSAPAAPALRISTNPLSPPSPQHPALTPPSSTFAFFTLPAAPSTPPLTPSLATSPLNPSPFASAFTSTLLTAPNMAPPGTTTSLLPTASTPATPTAASDAAAAEPSQVPQALTGPTGDPAADSPLTPPLHASSAPALNTLTDSLSELPPVRRLGAVGNAVGKSTGFLSSLADSHDTKGVLGGRDSSIRALQEMSFCEEAIRGGALELLVTVLRDVLISEPLLPGLLQVQQLDGVDVEGAAPIYHDMWHRLQEQFMQQHERAAQQSDDATTRYAEHSQQQQQQQQQQQGYQQHMQQQQQQQQQLQQAGQLAAKLQAQHDWQVAELLQQQQQQREQRPAQELTSPHMLAVHTHYPYTHGPLDGSPSHLHSTQDVSPPQAPRPSSVSAWASHDSLPREALVEAPLSSGAITTTMSSSPATTVTATSTGLQTPLDGSQAQSQVNSHLGSVNDGLSSWGIEELKSLSEGLRVSGGEGLRNIDECLKNSSREGLKPQIGEGRRSGASGSGGAGVVQAVQGGQQWGTSVDAQAAFSHAPGGQFGGASACEEVTPVSAEDDRGLTWGEACARAEAQHAQEDVQQQAQQVQQEEEDAAALAALQGYLTAVTAKDCGIIITLQRVVWAGEGPEPEVGEDECMFGGGGEDSSFLGAGQVLPDGQQQQQLNQQQQQQCGKNLIRGQGPADAPPSCASAPLPQQQQQQQQQQQGRWEDCQSVAECAERASHVLRRPYSLLKLKLPGAGRRQVAWFKYKVAVIDLDFKAVSKIPRHAALDAEVLAAAAEHTELLDQVLNMDHQDPELEVE